MDERSFLDQVVRSFDAFLTGACSLEELVALVIVTGWEVQRLGLVADEVLAELEALLV